MKEIIFGIALILLVSGCTTGGVVDSASSDYRAGFDDGERSANTEIKLQARELRSCNAELERKTEVTREALELQAKTLSDVSDLTEQQASLEETITSFEESLAEFIEDNELGENISDLNQTLNDSFSSLEESHEELGDKLMDLQSDVNSVSSDVSELSISVEGGFENLEQQIDDLNACTT